MTLDDPAAVHGRRVIVVEDGPTLTHGSMTYGAGVVGARAAGAAHIVDPVPYAVGSIAATYAKYPNARGILPAMGYGAEQVADLEATIRKAVDAGVCDAVVAGTPIDLTRVLTAPVPIVRARYELREVVPGGLASAVRAALPVERRTTSGREACHERSNRRVRRARRAGPPAQSSPRRVAAPARGGYAWLAGRQRRHALPRQQVAGMGGGALPHGRDRARARGRQRVLRRRASPTSSTSSPTRRASRALGDLVSTGVGFAAIVRMWQVFPFDVDGTAWEVVVRVLLVVAMFGSAVAIMVGARPSREGTATRCDSGHEGLSGQPYS